MKKLSARERFCIGGMWDWHALAKAAIVAGAIPRPNENIEIWFETGVPPENETVQELAEQYNDDDAWWM